MRHRWIAPLVVLAALSQSPSAISAQRAAPAATKPARTWTPARTPDGQFDLEGVWDFSTITPMERPNGLGNKETFSDEEAASFEQEENLRQNRDLIDDKKGGLNYLPGSVVPYNEFWYERGSKIVGSKRTSLVVDPSDGRIPPMTRAGQQRVDAIAEAARDEQLGRVKADSWEDRSLADRCILGFNAGPPMTPGAYNNHVQIFQSPGYIVLVTEMVHDARIIPVGGRVEPARFRTYKGGSRAHWEGHTLVIETSNFRRETSLRGSTPSMRLVERLTRVDGDALVYEFTVDDPTTWTKPWTVAVPMKKVLEPMYEYACHEGNYALPNILRGARVQERREAGK